MEVKFDQKAISCLRPAVGGVQKLEQIQELRLPEEYPDIGRILGCWGQVLLRGKEWRSTGMGATAGVMAWVLYAPEDGSDPRALDAWIPFSCKWDFPEPTEDGSMFVGALLTELDGRGTSARKIMLRACVDLMGQGMIPAKTMLPQPEHLPEDVYLRRESYPVQLPTEAGEKQMQLEQQVSLPEHVASQKLVGGSLQPRVQERKLAANRLILRGEAMLCLRYIGPDGSLLTWQTSIPFSQFAELDRDYESQALAWTEPAVTALELIREENGQITVKAGMALQYLIYDRYVLELITDAYSPWREVEVRQEMLRLPVLLDMRTTEIQVRGVLEESGIPADITPMANWPELQKSGESMIQLDGHYQLLIRDMEGKLRALRVPYAGNAVFDAASENDTQLWIGPGDTPTVVPDANGSMIGCTYPVMTMAFSGKPVCVVSGLELGEEKTPDPNRPSLILRRAGEEDLWTLAKGCGSTVDAIRKANQLQQEPEMGQMLLIPVC